MILETLNIFLGFVGIMLLLSLMVTALVQAIQSLVGLRARNLKIGIQALVEKFQAEQKQRAKQQSNTVTTSEGSSVPEDKEEKGLDQELSSCATAMVRDGRFVPCHHDQEGVKPASKFAGPAYSWISPDELTERLVTQGLLTDDDEKGKRRVEVLFQRMEAYLNKRFLLYIRYITFVCALGVAVYFQVSTPALLNRLATDSAYREAAATASEHLYVEAETLLKASTNYQNVAEMALEKLAAKHPAHIEYLEQVSGVGEQRGDLLAELEAALAPLSVSDRAQLVKDYELLLDGLRKEAATAAAEQLESLTGKLAAYDITPWASGRSFYAKPANYIGVLMTAILISFGAPFWYDRLRELIHLRDALKPKKSEAGSDLK
jgi:hypothetical protein